MHSRPPVLRLATIGVLVATVVALLLTVLPTSPAQAAPRQCDGAVTFAKKGHIVVTYRGVTCKEAKRILKGYNRGTLAEPPWRCRVEKKPYRRFGKRLITVSCGYGTGSSNLRSKSHAFVATIRA